MQQSTDERARDILRGNDKGGYTVPTAGLYPYQWNWDSAFVALGFATFDESRACKEIETLFEGQWEDGFLPHILFRRDDPDYFPGPSFWQAGEAIPSSGITQPPVAASIVKTLWSTARDPEVKQRLANLFPKLLGWHRWFHRYRVSDDCGAVVITHPWESGRDNSPEWDTAAADIDVSGIGPYTRRDLQHADAHMRPTKDDYDRYVALVEFGRRAGWDQSTIASDGPFRVADVGMTMILLRATRDLLELARNTGHHESVNELENNVNQLLKGADYLWDASINAFCSRNRISEEHTGFITSASFLYGYADAGSDDQRRHMADHWHRISAKSEFMMPSHDPDDDRFDHMRYWRGPIWLVINYMLAKGFEEQGEPDWSARIIGDSKRLVEEHGFHEAFSPMTGSGTGGRDFSWTAAMWLAWCGERD